MDSILNIFNIILKNLRIQIVKSKRLNNLLRIENDFERLIIKNQDTSYRKRSVSTIIFSKDRPLQLHALLNSINDQFIEKPNKIYILYKSSKLSYEKAYLELKNEITLENIFWKDQGTRSFKTSLLEILRSFNDEIIFFLVDDIIFIRPVILSEWTIWPPSDFVASMRLGNHLNCCFNKKNVAMPLPIFRDLNISKEFLIWDWSNGQYDWRYPLSVDGHFFSTSELTLLAELLDYNAPNSFEACLQQYQNIFSRRKGVCMNETRLFNVPANIVQDEHENIHGTFTTEKALKYWSQGKRIDVSHFYGLKNQSVHQLIKYLFK